MLQSGERIGAEAVQLVHSQYQGESLNLPSVHGLLDHSLIVCLDAVMTRPDIRAIVGITPVSCTTAGIHKSPEYDSYFSRKRSRDGPCRESTIAVHMGVVDRQRTQMKLGDVAVLLSVPPHPAVSGSRSTCAKKCCNSRLQARR